LPFQKPATGLTCQLIDEDRTMGWEFCRKWDSLKRESRYFLERLIVGYFSPVNFSPMDFSPEAIQRDVEYAVSNATFWLNLLADDGGLIKGKKVLEIGPGINLGAMLILAGCGAEVMVADRFLPFWDPNYHAKFYALLRESLTNCMPSIDLSPLDTVISQSNYPPEIISLYPCSLEELSCLPDNSVDMVVSIAVLEHLYNVESAFNHLSRITKPGGLGSHMVDFRDHRDSSRPLDFLLLSEVEFYGKFKAAQGEIGNRYRPKEMQQCFELAGFEVKEFLPHMFTDEEYLTGFISRLRKARKSKYCSCPVEDLHDLSGRFLVVKKAA
jgi:SAM-dependent methyltransferase